MLWEIGVGAAALTVAAAVAIVIVAVAVVVDAPIGDVAVVVAVVAAYMFSLCLVPFVSPLYYVDGDGRR